MQRHHKVVQPDLVRAWMAHVLAVVGVVLLPSKQQPFLCWSFIKEPLGVSPSE